MPQILLKGNQLQLHMKLNLLLKNLFSYLIPFG